MINISYLVGTTWAPMLTMAKKHIAALSPRVSFRAWPPEDLQNEKISLVFSQLIEATCFLLRVCGEEQC